MTNIGQFCNNPVQSFGKTLCLSLGFGLALACSAVDHPYCYWTGAVDTSVDEPGNWKDEAGNVLTVMPPDDAYLVFTNITSRLTVTKSTDYNFYGYIARNCKADIRLGTSKTIYLHEGGVTQESSAGTFSLHYTTVACNATNIIDVVQPDAEVAVNNGFNSDQSGSTAEVVVKRGRGTFTTVSTDGSAFGSSHRQLVLEGGTWVIKSKNTGRTFNLGTKFVFAGDGGLFRIMNIAATDGPYTFKNGSLVETAAVTGHDHGFSGNGTLAITGGDVANQTFSGRFIDGFSLTWSPSVTRTLTLNGATHTTTGALVVTKGEISLTDGGRFDQLGELTVASGAVFSMAAGTRARVDHLTVEDGGIVRLAAGICLFADRLTVGGVEQPVGAYYSSAGWIEGEGAVCIVPAEPARTVIWDGGAGAADTAITTAANWVGDVLPQFDMSEQMVFAAAGDTATVSGEKMVHALVLTNAAEVAEEGPTSFTLKGATSDPDENVLTVFGKGVVDQQDVSLTLENITLATPLHDDQGTADPDGEKTLTLSATNAVRYPLVLVNSIVEKPICVKTPLEKASCTSIRAEAGVNEIKGHYNYACSQWQTMTIDPDATLILSGGATCDYKSYLKGGGTLIITNKPWVATKSTGNRLVYFYGEKAVFAVPGNFFGVDNAHNQCGFTFYGGTVTTAEGDFLCDYAFDSETPIHFYLTKTYSTHLEFHDTIQKFSRTTWGDDSKNPSTASAGSSWIHGDEGSCFWVSNINTSVSSVQSSTSSNACLFTGAIDVRKSGKGLFTLSRTANMIANNQTLDHTSTGTLRVDGGTLGLDAGVSWRSGGVEIAGDGVLSVVENRQLGSCQNLAIWGTGQISIPEGVTVRVSFATVDGADVARDTYTAAKPGPFEGHIKGGGSIRVHPAGLVLIVR